MFGDAATKENDFAFNYMPKVDRNYSWTQIWDNMYRGSVKGMFAFGMNGVAIGPDSQKNIDALKKADFLVVGEIYPDETSEFWKSPGITPEEMKNINTTVYRLACAGFAEKDGSMTNSARWLQWKNVAVPPPGECRLDQDIVAQIFLKVRELYQKEGGKFPDPILNLTWGYTNPQHPALGELLKEINGKALADLTDPKTQVVIKKGQQLPGFAWLKDDGTTSCGNWIYSGQLDRGGKSNSAPRHRRSVGPGHLPELGVVVAGESPRAVQPRFVRSLGQALGCDAQAGVVERVGAKLGGKRCARLQAGFQPERPHGTVHHESRRRRPDICASGRCSPMDRSPSTTSRSRVRCKTRCTRTSRTIPWSRSSRRRRTSTPRRATAST